jgi:hypothetical protein
LAASRLTINREDICQPALNANPDLLMFSYSDFVLQRATRTALAASANYCVLFHGLLARLAVPLVFEIRFLNAPKSWPLLKADY